MKTHPIILALSAICISVFLAVILIELGLRLFPVQSYMPLQPVTQNDPVLRYKPNRNFTYSAGWNFDASAKGRINAQGWVNDNDYIKRDRPSLAVIGDSYIQASMVEHTQTLQGQLGNALKDQVDVFSFGIGGAPMSQYLIFAQHARDLYKPDFMIVNIVGNDFDESLPQYKNKPRFHYFVEDNQGNIKPQLIGTYKPSTIKELASHSALVRYFYFHLNLAEIYNKFLFSKRQTKPIEFIGNVEAIASNQKIKDSKIAIDTFLTLLPEYSGLPKDKIILIIDGIRSDIYTGTDSRGSYFGQMRRATIAKAQKQNYTIIDMHPVFKRHYKNNQKRFDFMQDAHWNSLAHALASQEVQKTKAYKAFIEH